MMMTMVMVLMVIMVMVMILQEGKCLSNVGPPTRFDMNPTSWCDVRMDETIFMKWGGEAMRTQGFMCNASLQRMEDWMRSRSAEEPALQLVVPEVLMGGALYDLYKVKLHLHSSPPSPLLQMLPQWLCKHRFMRLIESFQLLLQEYNAEVWLDNSAKPPSATQLSDGQKVCFAVRVHDIHDEPAQENSHSPLMNKDLELLIASKCEHVQLLRYSLCLLPRIDTDRYCN